MLIKIIGVNVIMEYRVGSKEESTYLAKLIKKDNKDNKKIEIK